MNSSESILLLERNPAAVDYLFKTFQVCGIANKIFQFSDVAEVLAYLKGASQYSDREKFPRPCLLLLDLVEHRNQTIELIQELRKQNRFERLPIVVMADDVTDHQIQAAFDKGANAYFLKGAGPEELRRILASLSFVGDVLRTQDIKDEERSRKRSRKLSRNELLEQMRQAVSESDPCLLEIHVSKEKEHKRNSGDKSNV